MKKATNIFILLALCLSFNTGYSQDVIVEDFFEASSNASQDISKLPKMDRDIYILQNILNDLFNGERSYYRSSRKSKGIYIPNNGVIFNIGGNGIFGGTGYQSWDELVVVVDGSAEVVGSNYSEEDLEKLNDEKEKKLNELATTFLTNYGSLLGELKNNEKIQLSINYSLHVRSSSRRKNGQLAFVSSSKDENKRRLVASVSVQDIKDFESGKISLSQMESKVKTTTEDLNGNEMVDAKIMAGIFDDLFKNTYDGYLSRSGRTSWSYFEDFGLMYNINLNSRSNGFSLSTTDGGTTVIYDRNNKEIKADDFYKEIQDKYSAFEATIKENIIKYGRTLRSLKANEVVIVNVNVSANKRAKLPRTIQFMVSKSDIDAFAKGQKSLSQAKEAINIKKLSAGISNGSFPGSVYGYGSYQAVETRAERNVREAVARTNARDERDAKRLKSKLRSLSNN